MAYTNQLLSDAKTIANYGSNVLKNITCLPSVLGNILGANIVGEFAAIALEGIKQNFLDIADNISGQVQQVFTAVTNKLNQVKQLADGIAKAVCGVEQLITGLFRDAKDIANSMKNGFSQDEECQYIGAQLGACIRAKVYSQLSGQLQRNIINSDLYKDLAYGKISALSSISEKTNKLFGNINVPGIADNFLKAEAERVNRARIQLGAVNNMTVFGSNAPRFGRPGFNNYSNYNFNYNSADYTKNILVKQLPSTTPDQEVK